MLSFVEADLPGHVVANLWRPLEEVLLQDDGPFLVDGVTEVIPRLAGQYSLGIISDVGLTPGRVLREILRRDGLLPLFSVLTFSDETGVTKPVGEVFLRTLAALQARPEQAAHIGDLPETDVVGARSVGMRAVLFLGASNRQDGLDLADAAFEDYSELEGLLVRLGAEGGPGGPQRA
jgi:putative hydrolase of the HAD superfamily